MKPQTPQTPVPLSGFKKALFGGWLAKALTLTFIVFFLMVSTSYMLDLYYQKLFLRLQKVNPTQALLTFISPPPNAIQITGDNIPTIPGNGIQDTFTPTQTLPPNVTATPTPRITQIPGNTATPTPTHANVTSTNTPTSPPQATNTNSPTPTQVQASGCFVVVSGYLYNMQNGLGATSVDPNTGKSHVHTNSDYHCGTQSSPTDMTTVYLEKHIGMGCAARLAPYIVNPPAPTDPSCE